MSTLSHINNNSNLASSHLNKNMTGVENAIKRLASGEKFANIGEGVPERSISSSLSSSLSSLKMGKSNANQALSILNAGYSVMDDSYNILNRQRELAMQAASDTMTDKERVALDIDYKNLIEQIKDNSAFEYNGMKLVDGTYSGEAQLNTYQGERLINVFDDISQFSATGTIGKNALIQMGSTIEATGDMGKTAASNTISLDSVHNGGSMNINGKTVFILTDQSKVTDPATQLAVGADDLATRQNLVTFLNSSQTSEIAQHNYKLNDSNDLLISHNKPGFKGNYSSMEVNFVNGNNNGEFVLKGGEDLRDRAAGLVLVTTNYGIGDVVAINGEEFTFKNAADVVLSTDISIGNTINDTMDNLSKAVRHSEGTANQVIIEQVYASDGNPNHYAVISKEPGLIGNSISFNFGGGSAQYTYDGYRGAANDNKSYVATIEGLVSGVDLSDQTSTPHNGAHLAIITHISTDELTFDQKMQGTFGDKRALFKPGTNFGTNEFEPNKVQFMAYLNGELYQTNDISLSGGSKVGDTVNGAGYQGLGNKISGGTELVFHKIGAKNTDVGFTLKVKDEGVTIHSANLQDIQQELNAGAQSVTKAMELGNVSLGILGSTYMVEDFGLNSTDQFYAAGKIDHDYSTISSNIKFSNNIGDVKSQGTVQLVANPVSGDQVVLNGTTINFGQEVSIGNSIKDTRNNLLNYLNSSTDSNLSKAVYYASDDVDNNDYSVVVQYKQAGHVGNSFALSTNNTDSLRLNDLKLATTSLGDNSNFYNDYATVGRKALGEFAIFTNFTSTEDVSIQITGLGINNSFRFLGEQSTTEEGEGIYRLTGLTTHEESSTRITNIIQDFINNSENTNLHKVEFSSLGNKIIAIAKEEGESANDIAINSSFDPEITSIQLSGGTDILWQTVRSGKNVVSGVNLEQDMLLPITSTLQGSINNLDAVFNEGSVNSHVKGQFSPNHATFSANIGGKLYSGDVMLSGGSITDGKASGTNYNRLGDKIVAGSEITLTSGDKSHAVSLSFDKEVDLSGKTKLAVLKKLSDAVANMNEELSDIKIYQQRTLSNIDVSKAESTVLEGLNKENIRVAGADFAADGSFKNISQFKFDGKSNKLSVTMGGREYSQVFSNSVVAGGLGERYDTAHKTIRGGIDTTIKLTNDQADDFLSINLYGVANVNLSNDKRSTDFVNVLNKVFSSEGNDGLSFQVGATLNDTVGVTFQDISTAALYRDNNGAVHANNNILTKGAAVKSFEAVEHGLDYLKSQIASTGAVTNQFINVDKKLGSVIDSMGDAVSNLLHISVPDAAAQYASESLKLQAATTAHGYHNSVVKDLVTSVLRG